MLTWSRIAGVVGLAALCGCTSPGSSGAKVWTHTVKDINGQDVDLTKYQGKVALIVNVASKCGFTPQYTALEAIYQKYKDQEFVILGFPCNDFLWQEPATNEEIKTFCSSKYNVTFDMFAKISVRGGDTSPLYKDLVSKKINGPYGGAIKWNFTKFLVGRNGEVVARFGPSTTPDDPTVLRAIEAELEKKP
ncbi:MAG: glutathione peroxidase [Candidatus Hydrogenedentes bacterium]|nr:glutathione peroxidase [Candidatus Hydrogenedentota bacterium]